MLNVFKYELLTWCYKIAEAKKLKHAKRLYFNTIKANTYSLKRLDNILVSKEKSEVRLFAIMRNESARLPHFIDYYKRLGVDSFFLVDNNSTDDSVAFALAQEKVYVFETKENYQNHWYWMEYLLETYGREHWCVVVDIDELFSYPHAEQVSLKELSIFLERKNQTAVKTFLLDMYSDKSIIEATYESGRNPLETVNCFDKDYKKMPFSFPDRITGKPYSFEIFTGGMRDRVFGKSNPPSILSKVPFFKNVEGVYLSQGMHAINGATLSEI